MAATIHRANRHVFEQRFDLSAALHSLRCEGNFREPIRIDSAQGPRVHIGARELHNFCSNDYLGLAADARVAEALYEGARKFGAGSGASALVCGRSRAHADLEERLAAYLHRERALIFSSGYLANLAVGSALLRGRGAVALEDRLNHASLIDAAPFARARLKRYRHADPVHLRTLAERGSGRQLVLTDSIFSMDGDVAPLAAIARVCADTGALLMVDEAHGFCVLGGDGRGAVEEAGLDADSVPLVMATFGKALGTGGAFVAGSAVLIESLIQFARPYIYTTALSPALAAATSASLQISVDEPWRRTRLRQHVEYFRSRAAQRRIPLTPSRTPIQPLILGESEIAQAVSRLLFDCGVLVTAIRPPTVPRGGARLRITFSAAHDEGQIDLLVDALAHCLDAAGVERRA